MTPFAMTREPIDVQRLGAALRDDGAGACVEFQGWVRDHNEGRPVIRLEYEAFDELALSEGAAVVAEALDRFDIVAAGCVHRSGELVIGDCAVWAGASATHRGAAFDACRYIIDEVKARVPIWKKEFYRDGHSGWINAPRADPGAGSARE